jgi:Icc protein
MSDLKFRIVQISDTHLSRFGNFEEKMFDRALKDINNLDIAPDVIVHTGDITDRGVLSEYEFALQKINLLDSKVLFTPGNHDERNYGHSLYREMIGPLDSKKEIGDLIFFIMNSPEPDRDDGRLGRRRQNYLENNLKKIPKDKIKIVVFHHHLIPVPFAGRERNLLNDAGDILETVLTNNVTLVLMGHRHVRRFLRINNTILINAGTVSSIRTRGRLGHSFNIIDIYTDGRIKIIERSISEQKNMLSADFY